VFESSVLEVSVNVNLIEAVPGQASESVG